MKHPKKKPLAQSRRFQAAADKLSGAELDAAYGGTGEAVKAGYGTVAMFGTSLGYEAELAQRDIADASAKYGAAINDYNAKIVAAVEAGDNALAASLAASRDTAQTEWDTSIGTIKTAYTLAVSELINGMMKSQPEAAAQLEKIAKQYDLMTALQNAMNIDDEAAWREFFSPEVIAEYLPNIADFEAMPTGMWGISALT